MGRKRDSLGWRALAESPACPPRDVASLGFQPFTTEDRDALSAWLEAQGWPRDRMTLPRLEGHLVALLVWPVDVPPGVWLPPIWGGGGWKVPARIASPHQYQKFIALIVGFLQHLDRELEAAPGTFVPSIFYRDPPYHERIAPVAAWAQGFVRALLLGSQGLRWRSEAARRAVSRIAQHASCRMDPRGPTSFLASELSTAVHVLREERASRGPLGPLEGRGCRRCAQRTGDTASVVNRSDPRAPSRTSAGQPVGAACQYPRAERR
jgi:yecA family protein